jgi:hypothetical protein
VATANSGKCHVESGGVVMEITYLERLVVSL